MACNLDFDKLKLTIGIALNVNSKSSNSHTFIRVSHIFWDFERFSCIIHNTNCGNGENFIAFVEFFLPLFLFGWTPNFPLHGWRIYRVSCSTAKARGISKDTPSTGSYLLPFHAHQNHVRKAWKSLDAKNVWRKPWHKICLKLTMRTDNNLKNVENWKIETRVFLVFYLQIHTHLFVFWDFERFSRYSAVQLHYS